jgi:hypothetical protein
MREADGYTGFDLRVAATTDEDLSGYDSLGGDADPVFVISLAGEEMTRTDDVVPLNDTFLALAIPNDTLVQHPRTRVILNVSVWDEDVSSEEIIHSRSPTSRSPPAPQSRCTRGRARTPTTRCIGGQAGLCGTTTVATPSSSRRTMSKPSSATSIDPVWDFLRSPWSLTIHSVCRFRE